MNTMIYQTIRAGVVFGVALFAFAGEVFAAPTLLPVSTTEITSTSVVLRGYAQSYDPGTMVWFEWSEASSMSAPTVFAMRGFYGDGIFEARLEGLMPGTTYSFHSVAKGGGTTIISPTVSFKTLGGASSTATSLNQGALGLGAFANTNGTSQKQISSNTATSPVKKSAPLAVVEKKTASAPTVTTEGFTNGNSAAVIGAGNNMFPSTFVGWLFLLVLILVAIIVAHMLYEAPERRRVARIKKIKSEDEELAVA